MTNSLKVHYYNAYLHHKHKMFLGFDIGLPDGCLISSDGWAISFGGWSLLLKIIVCPIGKLGGPCLFDNKDL